MVRKIKIFTVVGARPQFIKASVLSRLFLKSGYFNEYIVHTGQHFDSNMSSVFFDELDIPEPAFNLGINSLSNEKMVAKIIDNLSDVVTKDRPDLILVYGDTNSTLAGALCGYIMNIPVVHVEAGLRSGDLSMPEEKNRIITDRVAAINFCPTTISVKNLMNEGMSSENVILAGDLMYDSIKWATNKLIDHKGHARNLVSSDKFVVATIHRAENLSDPLRLNEILQALCLISKDYEVILPMHPALKLACEKINFDLEGSGIGFIKPQPYLCMQSLIKDSQLILTDSGGVQKEAYMHEKPCLTFRNTTEWTETLDSKSNKLVDADAKLIVSEFYKVISLERVIFQKVYGDGDAGEKILRNLYNRFK